MEQETAALRDLPTQVAELGSQLLQLHADVRGEFSAIRRETATREALEALALEMRQEFAAVRREMASEIAGLRAEMIAGDAETRRHMRTLHEEVIGRLSLIQEGMPRTRRRKSR